MSHLHLLLDAHARMYSMCKNKATRVETQIVWQTVRNFCFEVFLPFSCSDGRVAVGAGCQERVEGGRMKSEPDFIYSLLYFFQQREEEYCGGI